MKTGLSNAKNILFFVFIISSNIYAQIPINGFCSYSEFNAPPGYNTLLSYNFNDDPFADILLYSREKKSSVLFEADAAGKFGEGKKLFFNEAFSSIKNLSFGEVYSNQFISLSRSGRTAELLKPGTGGGFVTLYKHKFSSFPCNGDIEDIERDGFPEVIVTGPAFDGISILNITGGKIIENKILKGKAYKTGSFCDLNNDTYPDIAAVNILEQKIDFYFNNSRGKFNFTRTQALNTLPFFFDAEDLDFDTYDDLIWSEPGKINILYGDPFSSYKTESVIYTRFNPISIITGDFNKDGNKDIVYADTVSGIVSIIFAFEGRRFSEELILFRKHHIKDIIPYYSRFITGIAALSEEGKIYTVTPFNRIDEGVNIAAGLQPGVISNFDDAGNNVADICYIDEDEMQIKFILRNIDGIPEKIYKYKVHFPHKEVLTDRYSRQTRFYLWTRGENNIEIISADFKANSFSRDILYCSGKIQDVKIKADKDNPASVYAVFTNNGIAGANIFQFKDFRYTKSDYPGFALATANINTFISAGRQGFYAWQGADKFNLNFYDVKHLNKPSKIGETAYSKYIFSFSGISENNPAQVSVFSDSSRSFITFTGKKFIQKPLPEEIKISNIHQLYTTAGPGGIIRMYAYLPYKKSLNLITLYNKGKNLTLSEKISGINVNRYIVHNMDLTDTHIIYSDPEKNCISIKHIR